MSWHFWLKLFYKLTKSFQSFHVMMIVITKPVVKVKPDSGLRTSVMNYPVRYPNKTNISRHVMSRNNVKCGCVGETRLEAAIYHWLKLSQYISYSSYLPSVLLVSSVWYWHISYNVCCFSKLHLKIVLLFINWLVIRKEHNIFFKTITLYFYPNLLCVTRHIVIKSILSNFMLFLLINSTIQNS